MSTSRNLPPAKKTVEHVPARLRQLADDCEERARRSDSAAAKNIYYQVASEARLVATTRHLGDCERADKLVALSLQSVAARWHDGDRVDEAEITRLVRPKLDRSIDEKPKVADSQSLPTDYISMPPPDAMNARQLSNQFGMTERTARRAIERGVRNGWPGFYRNGCHWRALPGAFDRARQMQVSELRPNNAHGLQPMHDEGHNRPPIEATRQEADCTASRRGYQDMRASQ